MNSLRDLSSKGGSFKKAADRIRAVLFAASNNDGGENPLNELSTTYYGENRIKHCVKYNLAGAARLITTQHNGLCLFCFAGDHNSCDKWLDRNTGQTPVVDKDGKLSIVQVSTDTVRITGESALTHGYLCDMLPEDDFDLLIEGLSSKTVRELARLESVNGEDDIYLLIGSIDDTDKSQAIYDIFSLLRQNKREEAYKRLDLYLGKSLTLDEFTEEDIANLANSSSIQSLSTNDPRFSAVFQRYVEIADYMDWMLFLHPDQTDVVDKDFKGPAKLLGVSGSGKTCVVVKRAIRLAEQYQDENILVLTLNRPLAVLIEKMVDASCLEDIRGRIHVKPFFKLCQEFLRDFEPKNKKLYDDKTWKSEEHIDEIWREYYRCELNNVDAEVLHPVHDSLISRGVSAEQYIREEFDWIRSAVSPVDRSKYKSIARKGRSHQLDKRFRSMVLDGLSFWEKKMIAIGVTDYLGITSALYKYLDRIKPIYRCVLIDEAQDFGTTEYQIIRALVVPNENDLFFCGDAAQQVSAKHQSFKDAAIEIHSSRTTKITKNYRNSYEILTAAEDLLMENLSDEMLLSEDFEILSPQFADFSSSVPLVLKTNNLENEIAMGLKFLADYIEGETDEKACLAICGYSLFEIQSFGKRIGLPVLDGAISIDEHNLYLSDLEQTKGFEFDAVCIVNCNDDVLPNPLQPEKEQFRDLSRFYVAMTRAKMQLVVSYSGKRSSFISQSKVKSAFQENDWSLYVPDENIRQYGTPLTLKEIRKNSDIDEENKVEMDMSGPELLYTRRAIGMSNLLIEKLRVLIPGKATRIGGVSHRTKWAKLRDAQDDTNKFPRARNIFGEEGLKQFKSLLIDVQKVEDEKQTANTLWVHNKEMNQTKYNKNEISTEK